VFARVYRIALAYSLLESALHMSLAWGSSFAIKAAIAIVLTLPSLLGTKPLTLTLAIMLIVFVVAPYAVLTGWGYSQESITANATVTTSSGEPIDWVGLGNTLFWSFDGFHMTSTVGGHVLNPARTFPHAIYFTFLAVYMLYLLPMLASYGAVRDHWRQLSDWSFPALANRIGGPGLRGLIIVATVVGLLGMYMAQVFCEGYQLSGMADVALVPKILKRYVGQE
jgi:amino acid transporter